MPEVNQSSILDLDVYGRNATNGGALVHMNDIAVSNAIVFFLTASKGDYLYKPQDAGIMDEMLFKLLNPQKASFFESKISKAIEDNFGALVENVSVSISPMYEDRYYQIDIVYNSKQTGELNQAVFYTKPKNLDTVGKTITDVTFVEDNLLAFVIVKKEELTDPLLRDSESGQWYWGTYRLVNFNEQSSNFQEIFNIINN